MPRPRGAAAVALLAVAAACAAATAVGEPPHVAAARDWLASSVATVDDASPYVDVVACFLNVTSSAIDAVHLQMPHAARRARPSGDVVANLALAAPATEVGVGVNDQGVVTSLRFVTAQGDAKCGYWDPAAEVVVRGAAGTALAGIRVVDMACPETPLLTATSLRLEFARQGAGGARPAADARPAPARQHRAARRRPASGA
jgi:hypothetical protein